MKQIYTIYDNTNIYEDSNIIRLNLFEELASENGWKTIDDIPDKMIADEIEFINTAKWENAKELLAQMLSCGTFLLKGYCNRWNGRQDGGKFINDLDELLSCISHLDCIKITDVDGHLMIDGYHHDGNDHYELKKLTKKGYEYANSNHFANSRELHNKIFNCNLFSCLPRLAQI